MPTGAEADGDDAARPYVDKSGNLTDVNVIVTRRTDLVTVEVRGNAPRLVPGLEWSVAARSAAPVERLIPEPER